ncbi:MAG: PAS domain S-box protein [Chloroflexi bacterium]|nr:PAS domain S-box protein [Chloroflexota bacterium]
MQGLIHELQVHQIELEMQNEELRRAQNELEEARDRYSDLYDFAPAGHLTLDGKNVIREANLTAAALLGMDRVRLLRLSFSRFISRGDQDVFHLFRKRLDEMQTRQDRELKMVRADGFEFYASLAGIAAHNPEEAPVYRIALSDITERKRAEMELRESQERLALAIHSANVGLWDWDLRTNQVQYSREWKSQLGYEDHELSNDFSEWESRVHPEDLERAKATVSGYIANPYPNFNNEFRMRHRDGSYRWILAQASLLYDERGKPTRMIGSHIDITERKRAEDALRESEERFSTAFFMNPAPQSILSLKTGQVLEVNDASCQLFGYSREELIGIDPGALDLWNDPGEELAALEELQTTGRLLAREVTVRRKSGEVRTILFTAEQTAWKGEPCLITTSLDITKRKQAEEALRRGGQVLRLFVEHSPAAIAMFDRDMKYIVASRRYLIDYDLGEQNVVGRSHYDVFPEIPERWKEIHRRCLAGAMERAEEDPFPRADGRLDWVRWEIRPWYEANNEIGGVILFSEVITERKRARDEIRLHRDRLADLSRQLVEAHEIEQRAIGRELHDQIGQMLTALKLTIEVAMQMPPEQALQKAMQGKQIMDELINRVSRLSLELRPPMLDDLGLVPALLWHINRFQEQTQIEVDFKHSGVEGRRFASEIETTAYRVVQESLTNVARHARATRAGIEVRVDADGMNIQIEDDGAGFDPQAALDLNRGLGGMRERVHLVGGSFQIESQIGKGTRKIIRLPL